MTEAPSQAPGSRDPRAEVRRRALDLLARREHSVDELRTKLRAKAVGNEDSREAVLAALIDEGLLSDRRFAESFVESRRARGQGPLRIGQDLRQRGIDKAAAARLIDDRDADWVAVARAARSKRFGDGIPGDYDERARQARFLRSRGFTETQVRAAIGEES